MVVEKKLLLYYIAVLLWPSNDTLTYCALVRDNSFYVAATQQRQLLQIQQEWDLDYNLNEIDTLTHFIIRAYNQKANVLLNRFVSKGKCVLFTKPNNKYNLLTN